MNVLTILKLWLLLLVSQLFSNILSIYTVRVSVKVMVFNATFNNISAIVTTQVVNSNTANGEVYSIKHYEIKCVSDLQQVGGFLRFPPPIKNYHTTTTAPV
jgi:hypothetical protein